jgi:Integrase core domain
VAKKKVGDVSEEIRSGWIGVCPDLSIRRQCSLAAIPRSSWYYQPCGESEENLLYMRLWRDVNYEHVFLHEYENGKDLHNGLKNYFYFRNRERPHQALDYKIPWEVYTETKLIVP